MRKAILFAVVVASLSPLGGVAQSLPELPAGAQSLEASLIARVGPQTRAWIRQESARQASIDAPSEATVMRAVTSNKTLGDLGDRDVTALAFLVMMEAAKSTREDLKAIMDGVKQINDAKAALQQPARRSTPAPLDRSATLPAPIAQPRPSPNVNRVAVQPLPMSSAEFDRRFERAKNDPDSLSEMGEMESIRLQMAMNRQTKLMATLSNLMKRLSDTSSTITQNLK